MVEQIPSELRHLFVEARDTPRRRAAAQDVCQRLAAEGFALHPRGRELLGLVLGLTIHPPGRGADGVVPDPISFDPLAAASGERDRVQECEDACQTSLMPLGEVGLDLLLMASDGRLVLARPSEATVLGPDEASGWGWLLQRVGAPVDIDLAAHALLLRWLRARAFTVRRAEEVELTPRLRHDLQDPTVEDDGRLFLAMPKPFGLGLSLSGVTFTGARLSGTVTVYETMDAATGQSAAFVLPRVHRGGQGYRVLAFFENDEERSLCRRMVDAMTRKR